jgi:hypothetical protein
MFPNVLASAWIVGISTLPSTEYVLTRADTVDAGGVELTRFVTAPAADTRAGTPPTLITFAPWLGHYSMSQINNGSCVGAAVESYLDFAFDQAEFPGLGPESIFYTLSITDKMGGPVSKASFVGSVPLPTHPKSNLGWGYDAIYFHFDPGHEYCATLSARGDGDQGRPPLVSAPRCAPAVDVAAPGSGVQLDAGSVPPEGGASSAVGEAPETGSPTAAQGPATTDKTEASEANAGCSIQPGAPKRGVWSLLACLGALKIRRFSSVAAKTHPRVRRWSWLSRRNP